MNRILLTESEWMSSQLSIARWVGACRINGFVYRLDPRTRCLVREDYIRLAKSLGVKTLQTAEKKYGAGRRSKRILTRLYHIITCRKKNLF